MSKRGANRHQRWPSQSVFDIPDNLTEAFPEEIAPPRPAAQAPRTPPGINGGGGGRVHFSPQPPAKTAEEMPISDRTGK
ncbi:hypothetical protein OROHE_023795 [Orobanche hederae]